MFNRLVKSRPKHLVAVYIEPQLVEVVRAHRQWRTWQLDAVERLPVPAGEVITDFIQRMNLRPRAHHSTALLLFLSRTFYTFHREHYPLALQDQLEEALNFDWQENVFHEHDRTLHFFGPSAQVNRHISVPIFSIARDTYDKFEQALSGSSFQSFAVVPSALVYKPFYSKLESEHETVALEIIGRVIDPAHLEINRFYKGTMLDSMVVGKNWGNISLFREHLHCLSDSECQLPVHIHLLCTSPECASVAQYGKEWQEEDLPVQPYDVKDSMVQHFVRFLLQMDQVQTFDTELVLKPWRPPKVFYPIMALVILYSLFAAYQLYASKKLGEDYKLVKKQVAVLETQWKPIEELQTRIGKFEEDQKTLSQFNSEGYPVLEIITFLTQATSDETWLNYLSLKKGQLMLRGESKSAIKYMSELTKVEGLTDVRFASPVTRNPTSDQERFNVQLQIDLDKFRKVLDTLPVERADEGIEAPAPDPSQKLFPMASPSEDEESDDGEDVSEEVPPYPEELTRPPQERNQ